MVDQGTQEGDEVRLFTFSDSWRVTELTIIGHFAGVDVASIYQRQVIEFATGREPTVGIGIAGDVKSDQLFQSGESAIVEKRLFHRRIAQCGHLKGTAEGRVTTGQGALRAA